ncbi:MAG TPA: hypothetical protein VIJ34_01255 [Acidimicrobiales bacterium]
MTLYGVNKVSHLLQADPEFRDLMTTDPAAAIADLPLSDEERTAILDADVAALYQMGAHTFLLSRIPRFLPGLISRDEYIDRMRSVLSPAERAELEEQSLEPGQAL